MATRIPQRPLEAGARADRPGNALSWLRNLLTRHAVLAACLTTAVVHLMYLSRRLGPDEAGFLTVARHWDAPGGFLYGPLWVDRPPLLIAVFTVADHLGPYGARLVATLVAVGLVAAAGWAAGAARGPSAGGWAAWVAFAFGSSALLQAEQLNGELVASTAVMVSVGALLRGLYTSPRPMALAGLGILSGAAAMAAVFVKQNYGDAVVFALVLLLATLVARPVRRPRAQRLAAWFAFGALSLTLTVLVWAWSRHQVGDLAYAMYGFRADAARVLAEWSAQAPLLRLRQLAVTALVTGMLLLLVVVLAANRRRLRRPDPLTMSIGAALAVAFVGILAGGNYWSHYLIGLIPMTALAAGLTAADDVTRHPQQPDPPVTPQQPGGRRATRAAIRVTVVVALVIAPIAAYHHLRTSGAPWTTGRWIAESAHPRDTLTVSYTHANVVEASGLAPAYPYAWSLPLRTLDPDLDLLLARLRSPTGPTWFVQWDDADSWGLDPDGRLPRTLRANYRQVASVCDHPVWLRRGAHRDLAPLPGSRSCGPNGT